MGVRNCLLCENSFPSKRKGHVYCSKECSQKAYTNSLPARYKSYMRGAHVRGFVFDLSESAFDAVTRKPCHYCGQFSVDDGVSRFTGLDRINTDFGYYKDNVLPCCTICNFMKSRMSYLEFVDHIKKMSKHVLRRSRIAPKRFI